MARDNPGRIQRLISRLVTRVPWFRRRYSRWLLRYLAKSRKKGRPIPPELQQLERQLAKVPPKKRAEVVETALLAGDPEGAPSSRAIRRAMARQQRQRPSGKGQRPGTLGGSRVVERR
jgi:hypothetical protein